ncbi:hypothetical protein [Nostoc sp. ChiQUE01b]|nr:hypothetical protein [Nostoc sp. ChiQUE01b]MDZ8264467.1 hypothetical protein [Nostoc sp. ChiQUE01b]
MRDWLRPAVSPADRLNQSGASLQQESDRRESNDDQQAKSSLIAS